MAFTFHSLRVCRLIYGAGWVPLKMKKQFLAKLLEANKIASFDLALIRPNSLI
jgi:hypothetical protein